MKTEALRQISFSIVFRLGRRKSHRFLRISAKMNLVFRLALSVSACGFRKHSLSVLFNCHADKREFIGTAYLSVKNNLLAFRKLIVTTEQKRRPSVLVFLVRCFGHYISAHGKNIGDFLALFRLNTQIVFSEFDIVLPSAKDAICFFGIRNRINLGAKTVDKIMRKRCIVHLTNTVIGNGNLSAHTIREGLCRKRARTYAIYGFFTEFRNSRIDKLNSFYGYIYDIAKGNITNEYKVIF